MHEKVTALLKWNILMDTERKQCEAMSEPDKYRYFLLMQYRSPYGWGKENPAEADCSGAVCLALMMATGLKVRTTADGLYRRFFTRRNVKPDDIAAVFFIAGTDRQHGNRIARKGEVIHVAGVAGDGVVFNCVSPYAELRTSESLKAEYQLKGCDAVIRALDRDALAEAHRNGTDLYDLDEELKNYMEIT